MAYLTIGKIVQTRGLQGEVKIFSQTTFPQLRYKIGNTVFVETKQGYVPLVVQQYRRFQQFDLVVFKDYTTIEKAETLIGYYVFAEKEALPLKKGTYFFADLIGCDVFQNDVKLGVVEKVDDQSAQTLLRVNRDPLPNLLIPFIKPFIQKVDISKQRIDVLLVEGML
jgi:16S rRNA processing protein RimM